MRDHTTFNSITGSLSKPNGAVDVEINMTVVVDGSQVNGSPLKYAESLLDEMQMLPGWCSKEMMEKALLATYPERYL